ncbi:phytoene/squalene synthase family protein [Planococcus maritimus]|uniref:Phytoene/squalene synthase family protein n=1 Tax=Planococcus maritimus TaxID=192421 RepID=A0A7D7MCH3_PLAMR|nr:phytoene/squalene synthase family protein [Planococcus maritimus]KYG60268.1 phytoene synthase [Planococcus maritimus]OED33985.1 phytoene synthase [Planococcus maritimus]QMT19077.1 phytoene/squalene synthase family protein [Planococcus maritimus]
MELKQAYSYCERIIADNSKSFYKAFSLLPKEKRKAVWAVYAFCRKVDDIVDEGSHPEPELRTFRKEFDEFLAGSIKWDDPMWLALEDVFESYDMDASAFYGLIKGQEMDLTINRYRTLDELLDYSYHVASTVGLMLLPILAPGRTALLKDGAISLGYAMQITNILRDIGEDLSRGRIYLPQEIMRKYGLAEEALGSGTVSESFIQVWEELASIAESHYERAFETINDYPLSSRVPVKGAALVYREILSTIRSKEYTVFHEKHYVTDDSKQSILQCL